MLWHNPSLIMDGYEMFFMELPSALLLYSIFCFGG